MTNLTDAPLVSVVIPAYNAEATLRATLNSALDQTYRPIEIVVIDDGSTDGTAELVAEFAAKHNAIRYIRTANSGVAAARNTGIAASRGRYISPLDADDLWHPSRLAAHVQALEAAGDGTSVAYSPFVIIDADDRVFRYSPVYRRNGNVFDFHLGTNIVGNGSAMTVRRSAALAAGGYPVFLRTEGLEGCEDLYLQLRLAYASGFVAVPQFLTGYRKTSGNMSTNEARMLRSRVRVLRTMPELPGVSPRFAYRRALYDSCGLLVTWLLYNAGVRSALVELWRQVDGPYDAVFVPLFSGGHALIRGLRRVARGMVGPRQSDAAGPRFAEWINN